MRPALGKYGWLRVFAAALRRWLKGAGGDSLSLAAAASAATSGTAAAVLEEQVEAVECLGTSLLLMLQALPAQQLAAGRGAAAEPPAAGRGASPTAASRAAAAADAAAMAAAAASPAELLELEGALAELLPALCKACATAVSQQQGAAAAAAGSGDALPPAGVGSAAEVQARQAYVAVLVQLLIEILRHQLPSALWLQPVSQHLDLVVMVKAVAARANSLGPLPAAAPGSAGAGAPGGYGGSTAAAAVGAAVGVTDISVLELLQVRQATLLLPSQCLGCMWYVSTARITCSKPVLLLDRGWQHVTYRLMVISMDLNVEFMPLTAVVFFLLICRLS